MPPTDGRRVDPRVGRLVAGAALLVLGAAVAFQQLRDDDGTDGSLCNRVRAVQERVTSIEQGNDVPTSADYTDVARPVRLVAVDAPGDLAPHLHGLADAYGVLASVVRGFEPRDPSTYRVIETRAVDIERQQAQIERTSAEVAAWSRTRCR